MYAVIATGGKQYRVTEGARIQIEKVEGEPGQQVEFGDVLFVGNEDGSQTDLPAAGKLKVVGTIVEHGKGDKVVIFKFKKRKMYRRKQGHRQQLTAVRIDQIGTGGEGSKKGSAKAAETETPGAESGEE